MESLVVVKLYKLSPIKIEFQFQRSNVRVSMYFRLISSCHQNFNHRWSSWFGFCQAIVKSWCIQPHFLLLWRISRIDICRNLMLLTLWTSSLWKVLPNIMLLLKNGRRCIVSTHCSQRFVLIDDDLWNFPSYDMDHLWQRHCSISSFKSTNQSFFATRSIGWSF